MCITPSKRSATGGWSEQMTQHLIFGSTSRTENQTITKLVRCLVVTQFLLLSLVQKKANEKEIQKQI